MASRGRKRCRCRRRSEMLKTFFRPLVFVPILPVGEEPYGARPVCSLEPLQDTPENYVKAGDLLIGAILKITLMGYSRPVQFWYKRPPSDNCGLISFGYIRHMLTFMFAIEEINNRTDLLPNLTLGYHIYDTCAKEYKTLQGVMNLLSNTEEPIPNYSCHNRSTVVGFVGHLEASSSLTSASLTGVYHLPQIPGYKLGPCFLGPFEVLRRINFVAYKLRLPPTMRIPNSFHVSLLKSVIPNRFFRQVHPPAPEAEITDVYEVKGILDMKTISYGAMESIFSNKFMFPSFYRTVPIETAQYQVLVLLLKHFGWSWVGIVASDNESSQRASIDLQRLLVQNGICIEFAVSIVEDYGLLSLPNGNALRILAQSTCNVVILYSDSANKVMMEDIGRVHGLRKVFILFAKFFINKNDKYLSILNGSLLLHLHSGNIPHLKDYLLNIHPLKYPENFFLHELWKLAFSCLPENLLNISKFGAFPCTEAEDLRTLHPAEYNVEDFRFTFGIYAAVQVLAQAVDDIISHRPQKFTGGRAQNVKPWQINTYLRRVKFTTPGGEEIQLDENSAMFDILNVVVMQDGSLETRKVGSFYRRHSSDYQFEINASSVRWIPAFTKTPRSVCSASCRPGYQRLHQEGRQKCCHICSPCPKGEITNSMDMEKCVKCPIEQWSNERRDACIWRIPEYLSYGEALGTSLLIISMLFCFLTVIITGIFIKYKNTTIVKANNQNLSFILLLSLVLSFLCPLLFIGHPTRLSCLLRQVAFGNIFTVSISSVLAKTITVILAFNVIRPGNAGMKWWSNHSSIFVLLSCSFLEIMICVFWLYFFPPFQDYDTSREDETVTLLCNEGSAVAFFLSIGYIGFLAVLSFIVAFFARKLPDTFNEAQYITFSMLVFCSVWISFIPAYLSTKGKYMVVVEVFAILASGSGLLGCIFFPKCYIILLRPELNTKSNLIRIRFKCNMK
ncbi:vomeronasal type-2 receptor 26-like [Engystomops pustulosus]|uniref:vomeronasal type-2 receptor 26-like n=1 Tax=Engystomops pustulosus TaxID=76066 RepID=UPI003AFA3239